MQEREIKGRFTHKHDVEANWLKATNFIPKQGEIIIYDVDELHDRCLKVVVPAGLSDNIEEKNIIPSLIETLRLDPRPSYHNDPDREYGMSFAGYNVRFRVCDDTLTVTDITPSGR